MAIIYNGVQVAGDGGLPSNSQTFTSSGTFTVPTGVTRIMVLPGLAGSGGGGGGWGGDGGGGSASCYGTPIFMTVSPGQTFQ